MKVRVMVEVKSDGGETVARRLKTAEVPRRVLALYEAVGGRAGIAELLANDVVTGAIGRFSDPGRLMEVTADAPRSAPKVQDALGADLIEGIAANERHQKMVAPAVAPRPIGWGNTRGR